MTNEQIKLLREWQDDATVLLYAYFAKGEKSRRRSTIMGGASAALSAIVGTAVFASIGKSPHLNVQIAVGLTSVVAAVLAGLHSFLNLGEVAARYQHSGAGYAALRKQIEELIVLPPSDDNEARKSFQVIRERWDKLREESIPMSARTLKMFRGSTTE